MIFSNNYIVPVVMFHSVGLENSQWIFSRISEPLKTFEEEIAALSSSRYNFIFWRDLYYHMSGLKEVPDRSIMITFDDGYLDNWVYVFPILKKYGAKATIFVAPEFVDPGAYIRPNLDDLWWNKGFKYNVKDLGFLNWHEMRIMEESGVIDIQSHALTHTWYFSGPRLVGFHKPRNKEYPWMAWNARPDQKPFYMAKDQETLIPYGTPIYEHEKALICKRYFPPQTVAKEIIDLVKEKGGKYFFQQKSCDKQLKEYHSSLMVKHKDKGYFENKHEYEQRVYHELLNSKKIIEKKLKKKVEFICWPGGAYNSTVLRVAKKAGFKAWTLSSRDKRNFRNLPGSDPTHIKRIGSQPKYRWRRRNITFANAKYIVFRIEYHKGSVFSGLAAKVLLLIAIIKSKIAVFK